MIDLALPGRDVPERHHQLHAEALRPRLGIRHDRPARWSVAVRDDDLEADPLRLLQYAFQDLQEQAGADPEAVFVVVGWRQPARADKERREDDAAEAPRRAHEQPLRDERVGAEG